MSHDKSSYGGCFLDLRDALLQLERWVHRAQLGYPALEQSGRQSLIAPPGIAMVGVSALKMLNHESGLKS